MRTRNQENGRFAKNEQQNLNPLNNLLQTFIYCLNLLITIIALVPWILILIFVFKYFNLQALFKDFLNLTICSMVNDESLPGELKKKGI